MKHYEFAATFRALYDKAVGLYAAGDRGAFTYFHSEENAWLAANGLTAQHLYDYAEDDNTAGEPGYDIALSIEMVRRDYFLNVQKGVPSSLVLDETRLPAKTAAVLNIEWLPRLIQKSRAKLRGELPPTLMYCCGGDRHFFRTHDIHPAEFLSIVWRHIDDDDAIVEWVIRRSSQMN